MGSRGPAPKPTAILSIRGSRRVAQRRGEPQATPGTPPKPPGLTGEAGKVWGHVCKILGVMGVLTVVDGQQLERYARAFVTWRRWQAVVDRYDSPDKIIEILGDEDRRPIIRNAMIGAVRYDAVLKQIEAAFGMTPSARARIGCLMNGGGPQQSTDPIETKYFSGGA